MNGTDQVSTPAAGQYATVEMARAPHGKPADGGAASAAPSAPGDAARVAAASLDALPPRFTVAEAMEWIAFGAITSEAEANRDQRARHERWDETSDAARAEEVRRQEPRNAALEAGRLKLVDAVKRGKVRATGKLDAKDRQPDPAAVDTPIPASRLDDDDTTITAWSTLGPDPKRPMAAWGTLGHDPHKKLPLYGYAKPTYRDIKFNAADVLALWPPPGVAEAEQVALATAATSSVEPETPARPRPVSKSALRDWYSQRVREWDRPRPPNEAQDLGDAQAAFLNNCVTRFSIRKQRADLAPASWRNGGRPRNLAPK